MRFRKFLKPYKTRGSSFREHTRIEGGDICKFGGVEYDPELFQIACNNLKKFGFDINGLIKKDASLVTRELDDYNYFFIQNSFEGKTFDKVIQNIQESHDRKIREMVLIYAGTFCHVNVLKNSNFKLSKIINTDYWIRNVNVYFLPDR